MSDETPLKAKLAIDEDRRWLSFFDKIEENQLDLLDQAGKRIVELTGVLLGVLLGVTSFGDKFPPAYLSDDALVKGMVVLVLISYIAAMLMGMLTAYPRKYKRYPNNLTLMEEEFNKIVDFKRGTLSIAGICFFIGSAGLAVLLGMLVLQA